MSKWKVGDLVTLSAAGRKIDANSHLLLDPRIVGSRTVGFGMVVGFGTRYDKWPVRVQWYCNSSADSCTFKDYELKKYKADKKCP